MRVFIDDCFALVDCSDLLSLLRLDFLRIVRAISDTWISLSTRVDLALAGDQEGGLSRLEDLVGSSWKCFWELARHSPNPAHSSPLTHSIVLSLDQCLERKVCPRAAATTLRSLVSSQDQVAENWETQASLTDSICIFALGMLQRQNKRGFGLALTKSWHSRDCPRPLP